MSSLCLVFTRLPMIIIWLGVPSNKCVSQQFCLALANIWCFVVEIYTLLEIEKSHSCSDRSFWQNKTTWLDILLFHVLVVWVTISDWPLLLVYISFYSPHGSSVNVPKYSFGRISWNLPWHTLVRRFILLLANLQNKFEWGRDNINNLCLHNNWHRCFLL